MFTPFTPEFQQTSYKNKREHYERDKVERGKGIQHQRVRRCVRTNYRPKPELLRDNHRQKQGNCYAQNPQEEYFPAIQFLWFRQPEILALLAHGMTSVYHKAVFGLGTLYFVLCPLYLELCTLSRVTTVRTSKSKSQRKWFQSTKFKVQSTKFKVQSSKTKAKDLRPTQNEFAHDFYQLCRPPAKWLAFTDLRPDLRCSSLRDYFRRANYLSSIAPFHARSGSLGLP